MVEMHEIAPPHPLFLRFRLMRSAHPALSATVSRGQTGAWLTR